MFLAISDEAIVTLEIMDIVTLLVVVGSAIVAIMKIQGTTKQLTAQLASQNQTSERISKTLDKLEQRFLEHERRIAHLEGQSPSHKTGVHPSQET